MVLPTVGGDLGEAFVRSCWVNCFLKGSGWKTKSRRLFSAEVHSLWWVGESNRAGMAGRGGARLPGHGEEKLAISWVRELGKNWNVKGV